MEQLHKNIQFICFHTKEFSAVIFLQVPQQNSSSSSMFLSWFQLKCHTRWRTNILVWIKHATALAARGLMPANRNLCIWFRTTTSSRTRGLAWTLKGHILDCLFSLNTVYSGSNTDLREDGDIYNRDEAVFTQTSYIKLALLNPISQSIFSKAVITQSFT